MRRMMWRRSTSMGGRPRGRRDRQRHSRRQPARCHRMTVSGFTTRMVARRARNLPAMDASTHRSKGRRRGRLTCLLRTMTCWRRRTFSATSTARGATKASTRSRRTCRRVVTVALGFPRARQGRARARRRSGSARRTDLLRRTGKLEQRIQPVASGVKTACVEVRQYSAELVYFNTTASVRNGSQGVSCGGPEDGPFLGISRGWFRNSARAIERMRAHAAFDSRRLHHFFLTILDTSTTAPALLSACCQADRRPAGERRPFARRDSGACSASSSRSWSGRGAPGPP